LNLYLTELMRWITDIYGLTKLRLIDWLIIYCFTSRSRIFHLPGIWRRHRAAKFKLMLGA
jgi:hypothetical protein